MHFFKTLETILQLQKPEEKNEAFRDFYAAYQNGDVEFEPGHKAVEFAEPSYKGFCTIVPPQVVPQRKSPASVEGKRLLLHAIAHIEYSAIDLALDAAYRFSGLPKEYYDDWLEVADDEVRHFEMIEGLLKELGSGYGAFDVHDALFEASQRTQTLLERMAVVPRYLEANGLDATPQILQKLVTIKNDPMNDKIIDALNIILKEEVSHVQKGDRWFDYACEREGKSKEVYFDIIESFYPGAFPRKKYINAEDRKEAGFSCSELNRISRDKVC